MSYAPISSQDDFCTALCSIFKDISAKVHIMSNQENGVMSRFFDRKHVFLSAPVIELYGTEKNILQIHAYCTMFLPANFEDRSIPRSLSSPLGSTKRASYDQILVDHKQHVLLSSVSLKSRHLTHISTAIVRESFNISGSFNESVGSLLSEAIMAVNAQLRALSASIGGSGFINLNVQIDGFARGSDGYGVVLLHGDVIEN